MRATHTRVLSYLGIILALGASALLPGIAGAQPSVSGEAVGFQGNSLLDFPLFEQYYECTGVGPASQQFPDFGDALLQAADDFNVSGTYFLEQVVAVGSFSLSGPMGPVTFEIYANDGPGNLPGTLVCSEVGITSTGDLSLIDIDLDGSCELTTGTYWISVYPAMAFDEFGQWFWSSNEIGYGSEFVFQDPEGLVGNPCSTWGLGITDCGIGASYPNLCFGLGGFESCGDDGD